jgi:hypothetical protein
MKPIENVPTLEPFAVLLPDAKRMLGFGRSKIYDEIGRGNLEAVKDGKNILITVRSIRSRQQNLPAAQIKAPTRQRAKASA